MTCRFKLNALRHLSVILVALLTAAHSALGQNDSLVISFTGGYRGRIEGCGHCSVGPQGGLERRATLLRDLFPNRQIIGIDCGSILDLDPLGGEQRSRCAILGLARLNTRIIGLSARDMFYGSRFLIKSADEAKMKIVSSNIVDPITRKPIFAVWDTLQVDNSILALTSISESRLTYRPDLPGSWITLTPDSIVSQVVNLKPASANLYILLTDMGESELRRLLNTNPGFDLVITSNRQIFTPTPFNIGNATIIHPEPDGRCVDAFVFPKNNLDISNATLYREIIRIDTPPDSETTIWLENCLGRTSNK